MLTGNEFYIVLKLTSGEQVMACLEQEDDEHVMIDHPMVMKLIPDYDLGKEHITAHPLCAFSEETSFVLPKKEILFIKKLHHVFVPHYQRIVNDHEKISNFTSSTESNRVEAKKEINWDEKLQNLVPGSDTLN